MTRPTCSTPGPTPSTSEHGPAVKCDSNSSDLSDLLPQIDSSQSQISDVPDSVLLMSLGTDLFSPLSTLEDCSPENTPSAFGDRLKVEMPTSRVQFDEVDVRMERETIEALHGIICRNNVSVRTLFAFVSKDADKTWPFVTDAGLETYLKNRSFIFEISNRIHNRGFGYRENFVRLTTYIDKQCQNNGFCTLRDLMTNVMEELPVYSQDDPLLPWTDSWFTEKKLEESDLLELLSHDHLELFNLEKSSTGDLGDTKIRLTCAAFGVASLWQDCFPPMPTSLVWDESRIYSFTCSLSYVHEHHAIGTIQSGIYTGRLVYIHRSRVGPPDLRRTLAVGGMLSCTAHVTFNTTAQFRALSVVNNFNSFEVRKIGGRRSYDRDNHHSDQRREPRPTFTYRKLLRRAAESELSMITVADDLLSDSMYSHDGLQRRLFKYKSSHRNTPFANFHDFEFFIRQRPHLYTSDDLGTRRASPNEREIAIAFIQMIGEFGFCGVSKAELRCKLVNSSYPLKSIVVDKCLDQYIRDIFPVLEIVHLINPPEDLVMLRGTYIPEEHLFVHHFKPCFLPFD